MEASLLTSRRVLNSLLVLVILSLAFSCASHSQGVQTHSKLWGTTVKIGSLKDNTNFKYYLEPQLRLIDNQYKFEEALMLAGLGYQPRPNLILFLGNAWVASKRANGNFEQENRLWQQVNWNAVKKSSFNLISRTRLEERKNIEEPQWLIRFRERLMLRIPLKNQERYSFVLFDEVFFNLNYPQWLSNNHFFTQNRGFLGIGTKVSEQTSFDIGYMNQYQFTTPNQMGHVLLLTLNIIS